LAEEDFGPNVPHNGSGQQKEPDTVTGIFKEEI